MKENNLNDRHIQIKSGANWLTKKNKLPSKKNVHGGR
jgi:hypothetical protein